MARTQIHPNSLDNLKLKRTHGHSTNGKRSPTYGSWLKMRQRCYDTNNNRYYAYGAKGVRVCERWDSSFEAFLADMGERPEGMTIDRIDPYGDYTPENCRWADRATQGRNKRKKEIKE